jgi:hypothetical protein
MSMLMKRRLIEWKPLLGGVIQSVPIVYVLTVSR